MTTFADLGSPGASAPLDACGPDAFDPDAFDPEAEILGTMPGAAAGRTGEPRHAAATADSAKAQDFDSKVFRSVFRRHPAGIAVITAAGVGPVGFTATSLASVAAEPPLLSFGISTRSSCWPVISETGHVGVHLLGERQQELAVTFARSGADRFAAPTSWRPGPYGVPLLDEVPAWLVCRVVSRVPAGDHRIVVAEAVAGDPEGPGRPLLYHQGDYRTLGN